MGLRALAASSALTRFQASVELGAHQTGWWASRRDGWLVVSTSKTLSPQAGNTILTNTHSSPLPLQELHHPPSFVATTTELCRARLDPPIQLPQPPRQSC